MVVTEMRTPTSTPDLAPTNASIPTVPARTATMTENQLGSDTSRASSCSAATRMSGATPSRRSSPVSRAAETIPMGNPT
jgi:hypothetical protein